MIEMVDELIQIFGLSLIDMAFGRVTKRVQLPAIPSTNKSPRGEGEKQKLRHIPVVFMEPGELLVVDKPADLVINSNDKSRASVQTLLRAQFPELVNNRLGHEFFFVHRLDYATSGLLCIPLNKRRCSEVGQLFERRAVDKYYVAIVRGHIDHPEIRIDIPVGEDIRYKTSNNKMCTNHDWEHCLAPKRSETRLVVLERGFYETEFATKVLLKPVTGRRHQLRVHCSEIGHAIVGDFTYSSHATDLVKEEEEDAEEPQGPPRMMLHAFRIKLPATSQGQSLDLATEDPFKAMDGLRWDTKEVVHELADAFERVDGMI